jgi:hypothetical protein
LFWDFWCGKLLEGKRIAEGKLLKGKEWLKKKAFTENFNIGLRKAKLKESQREHGQDFKSYAYAVFRHGCCKSEHLQV